MEHLSCPDFPPGRPARRAFLHRPQRAMLGEANPQLRETAYAAAVVLMGDHCPQTWRALAKQLLFAAERPYFG